MKPKMKPSVLVCVTNQYNCDRLIKAGYEIAKQKDYDLRVLCVHTPISNISLLSDEIEYLYQVSKSLKADMTIAFNSNPPKVTADFVRKFCAKELVTGMPDKSKNGFIDTLSALLPKTTITMVTKEGEQLKYYHAQERALA